MLKEINVNLIHWKTDRLQWTAMPSNNQPEFYTPAKPVPENSTNLLTVKTTAAAGKLYLIDLIHHPNISRVNNSSTNIFNIENRFYWIIRS